MSPTLWLIALTAPLAYLAGFALALCADRLRLIVGHTTPLQLALRLAGAVLMGWAVIAAAGLAFGAFQT